MEGQVPGRLGDRVVLWNSRLGVLVQLPQCEIRQMLSCRFMVRPDPGPADCRTEF